MPGLFASHYLSELGNNIDTSPTPVTHSEADVGELQEEGESLLFSACP